jgi:hypothetical protein
MKVKRPFVTLCIFLFIGIMIAHLFDYSVSMYCVIFFVLLTLISFLIYEGAFNALLMFTVIFLGIYLYGQSITGSGLPEVLTPDSIIKVKILKEASHKRGYNEHEVEIITPIKKS